MLFRRFCRKDNRGKIHAVANCEAYDIKADRWIKLQDLPTPLFNLSLTVYNGSSLVAVGGTDGTKYTNSIMELKLDSPNNNWERLSQPAPECVQRWSLAAVIEQADNLRRMGRQALKHYLCLQGPTIRLRCFSVKAEDGDAGPLPSERSALRSRGQ